MLEAGHAVAAARGVAAAGGSLRRRPSGARVGSRPREAAQRSFGPGAVDFCSTGDSCRIIARVDASAGSAISELTAGASPRAAAPARARASALREVAPKALATSSCAVTLFRELCIGHGLRSPPLGSIIHRRRPSGATPRPSPSSHNRASPRCRSARHGAPAPHAPAKGSLSRAPAAPSCAPQRRHSARCGAEAQSRRHERSTAGANTGGAAAAGPARPCATRRQAEMRATMVAADAGPSAPARHGAAGPHHHHHDAPPGATHEAVAGAAVADICGGGGVSVGLPSHIRRPRADTNRGQQPLSSVGAASLHTTRWARLLRSVSDFHGLDRFLVLQVLLDPHHFRHLVCTGLGHPPEVRLAHSYFFASSQTLDLVEHVHGVHDQHRHRRRWCNCV